MITAAGKYGCRAVGYELDKDLVDASREMAAAAGVKSLTTFEVKDLFTADLSDADVIVMYLLPQQLEKLRPQLEKMRPGSRVISHQFRIPGVMPELVVQIRSAEDAAIHTLYLSTLPLKNADE